MELKEKRLTIWKSPFATFKLYFIKENVIYFKLGKDFINIFDFLKFLL